MAHRGRQLAILLPNGGDPSCRREPVILAHGLLPPETGAGAPTPGCRGSCRQAQPTHLFAGPLMEFVDVHASQPATKQAFATLAPVQRRYLEGWRAAAKSAGIDAVEDLGTRPWPQPGADTIIGVFRSGHRLATWLIVGRGGTWAVACCAEGAVSGALPSLADALAIICPIDPLLIAS